MVYTILLTAPRGAGKTTACERFLEHARKAGMRVGGILAPTRSRQDGTKVGIDVVDAFSLERRELATIEADPRLRTIGPFRFDVEVMAWALEQLTLALAAPIDVVLADEIGPLELTFGGGLAPALEAMHTAQAASAILVVRSELLLQLQELLTTLRPITITLTRTNRDQVPARLFQEVWVPVSQRWSDSEQANP
jgi:nucleoside-triphosphatase THEP1